ncbi:efflux RND transporter periplasmic adaptor subunit [Wenzhouxiangella sp. XN79A]|uniref:efflux RND transporter periplasmic adaptor subunit n=1 Tax=Wenzhouxiangella sp. XN79A TaxID=2724193 RepID=UPI00144A6FC2|nr:efflux RND transporter periplasmic adaptor subunit [Wenzhouxiangella sp. XN79A]NKI35326.1 efflux RND transporter periplasmic adaptor subunit [Wenzhouxiangella sp. XN79A]
MPRSLRILLPIAILIAAVLLFGLMVSKNERPERRAPDQAAMLVDAIHPAISQDRFMIEAQGTVQPKTRTTLVSEVAGPIVWMSDDFIAGGLFEAGQDLARIDPSDYEAALLAAEAELAAARATLADEQARSDAAREDFRRLYGDAREPGDLVVRLPQLARAEAAVQAREAAVMRARRDLERTRIRLPYDGMVIRRDTDLGQYVTPGTTLGVAFATDLAEVRLPMSDRELSFLDLPTRAERDGLQRPVTLTATVAGRPASWSATLVRTEGVVDENTRLTYVVAEIEDPYALAPDSDHRSLPIGTYVEAAIPGRDSTGLIVLPTEAVHGGNQVYLADADDRLQVLTVDIVRKTTDRVYIDNRIGAEDRIVTTAIPAPVPGLQLRVREPEAAEPRLQILPAAELTAAADDEADDDEDSP